MNAHYNKVFTTNGKLPECKDICTQAHSFWRSSKFVFNWEVVLYAPSGWRRDSSMGLLEAIPSVIWPISILVCVSHLGQTLTKSLRKAILCLLDSSEH